MVACPNKVSIWADWLAQKSLCLIRCVYSTNQKHGRYLKKNCSLVRYGVNKNNKPHNQNNHHRHQNYLHRLWIHFRLQFLEVLALLAKMRWGVFRKGVLEIIEKSYQESEFLVEFITDNNKVCICSLFMCLSRIKLIKIVVAKRNK